MLTINAQEQPGFGIRDSGDSIPIYRHHLTTAGKRDGGQFLQCNIQ